MLNHDYKFEDFWQDAEAHGSGKKISSNIAMLERNRFSPDRGDVCLRYVAATIDDADFLLGKILYKDMKGIRQVSEMVYEIVEYTVIFQDK